MSYIANTSFYTVYKQSYASQASQNRNRAANQSKAKLADSVSLWDSDSLETAHAE